MATWIKLYNNIWDHKKTFLLADKLKISEIYAAAHLIKLWTWAIDNAQDGDLTDFPNNLIAKAISWTKNPDSFVDACIESGWLDRTSDDHLVIHDWNDYSDSLVRRRKYDTDRKRIEREKSHDVNKKSAGQNVDVRKTSAGQSAGQNVDVRKTSGCKEQSRAEQSREEKSVSPRELSTSTSSSSSIESKIAASTADFQRIVTACESEIGLVTPVIHEKIQAFLADGIEPDLVITAFRSASLNNARSFRYVEQILNRCVREKIFTASQFEADALTTRHRMQSSRQAKLQAPPQEDIGQYAPDPEWLKVGDD